MCVVCVRGKEGLANVLCCCVCDVPLVCFKQNQMPLPRTEEDLPIISVEIRDWNTVPRETCSVMQKNRQVFQVCVVNTNVLASAKELWA